MSDPLYIDEMKMYMGDDIVINNYITFHTPSVGEIIEYGEKEYYTMISCFITIPSDMKSQLFDMGIDYEEISDFDLFYLLTRNLTKDKTSLLFYDLDFTKFEMCEDRSNNKHVMFDKENNIKLDELAYLKIVKCLRTLHSIKPKIEKAANKTTKRILIELDRERLNKQKNEDYKSNLKPLVSAMMRYPGFKYKSRELKECSMYEFMDTVQGAQIYVQSIALLQGSYSGMIDTSKINKKEFNWLRGTNE